MQVPITDGEKTQTKSAINDVRVLTTPSQLLRHIHGLSEDRISKAVEVARQFQFRVPEFYVQRVLTGSSDDPLLSVIMPAQEELADGEELWDSTPSSYKASDSPFWIQKYEFQGLIRLTTVCSGLCRFCYLKQKNSATAVMQVKDVDDVFDDLEQYGSKLQEIILSGGDPLCTPVDTLEAIGRRLKRLHSLSGNASPHAAIHTREPVWDPISLLKKDELWEALDKVSAKVVMINVLHPREVTREFLEVCQRLGETQGSASRPSLLCQHPLFRGVNDSVEILEDLYGKLLAASPPILPYYLVYPFYNGTLPSHRLSIEEAQDIYRQLVRRPGCLVPRLVIPTPWGKCIIGPHEQLQRVGDRYRLMTKDGKEVLIK